MKLWGKNIGNEWNVGARKYLIVDFEQSNQYSTGHSLWLNINVCKGHVAHSASVFGSNGDGGLIDDFVDKKFSYLRLCLRIA